MADGSTPLRACGDARPKIFVRHAPMRFSNYLEDSFSAALIAAIVGGIPSTALALLTGADVFSPTRAAGAMLIPSHSSTAALLGAAALVHMSVSFFWAAILCAVLPRQRTIMWAMLAAGAIAVLDLRIVGRMFPEIFALPFWPQFADHLAWGFTVGAVLAWRRRARRSSPPSQAKTAL
jgi:hypothetical protein